MVLSRVEILTVLNRVEGLRCAASFVIAAYFSGRLIPQDLRALHLELFTLPSDSEFYEIIMSEKARPFLIDYYRSSPNVKPPAYKAGLAGHLPV